MIDVYGAIGVALGFYVAILGHEYVTHVFAAKQGDPSPRFQGRLSLDIRHHADTLGTYVAPALFTVVTLLGAGYAFPIGYGKSHALQPPYQKTSVARGVLVPLAGPAFTLLLATILGRGVLGMLEGPVHAVALNMWRILLFLTALELLPIPGRDGGRILARFLPNNAALKMEELRQYEAVFLIGIYLLFPGVVASIASLLANIAV